MEARDPNRVAAAPWADRDLIFVGGLHRSGTTVLASAIGAGPAASGLTDTGVTMDEGQFLQDVYPVGKAMGGVTRWAFDARAHLTAADVVDAPGTARRLWDAWSPYWRDDAQHLVEKTPLNLLKTTYLQEVFPAARFVVITRHPVFQALAVRKWSPSRTRKWGRGFPRLVEHWVRAHEQFVADAPAVRHLHVVRFEDLAERPEPTIAALEDFLGFEVDRVAIADIDARRSGGYRTRWEQLRGGRPELSGLVRLPAAVREGSNAFDDVLRPVVESALAPLQDRRIKRKFGARVRALGYDLDDLGHVEPWPG